MTERRYIRQETLPQIGKAGQALLADARVALVGMGALGSASADVLVRSGVGYLRLIDPDVVELSNLQRCSLYTEADAAAARSKAKTAAEHLAHINSEVRLEPQVQYVDSGNILELISGVDLVLDCSDNFELRYLLGEAADKLKLPWIYTGVLGTMGMVMPVTPAGPCLCCLKPEQPQPGSYATCATEGILASTTRIAAALQASLALRMLLGWNGLSSDKRQAATLFQIDVWEPELERILVEKNPECPVCGRHQYSCLTA